MPAILAGGAGLVRDQARADERLRSRFQFGAALHLLHAAGLAAPAGVHLRLHHPGVAAQHVRRGQRLGHARGRLARRQRDAILAEQLLGLILVQIHAGKVLMDFRVIVEEDTHLGKRRKASLHIINHKYTKARLHKNNHY